MPLLYLTLSLASSKLSATKYTGWYSVMGYFWRLVLAGSKGRIWGLSDKQYWKEHSVVVVVDVDVPIATRANRKCVTIRCTSPPPHWTASSAAYPSMQWAHTPRTPVWGHHSPTRPAPTLLRNTADCVSVVPLLPFRLKMVSSTQTHPPPPPLLTCSSPNDESKPAPYALISEPCLQRPNSTVNQYTWGQRNMSSDPNASTHWWWWGAYIHTLVHTVIERTACIRGTHGGKFLNELIRSPEGREADFLQKKKIIKKLQSHKCDERFVRKDKTHTDVRVTAGEQNKYLYLKYDSIQVRRRNETIYEYIYIYKIYIYKCIYNYYYHLYVKEKIYF